MGLPHRDQPGGEAGERKGGWQHWGSALLLQKCGALSLRWGSVFQGFISGLQNCTLFLLTALLVLLRGESFPLH